MSSHALHACTRCYGVLALVIHGKERERERWREQRLMEQNMELTTNLYNHSSIFYETLQQCTYVHVCQLRSTLIYVHVCMPRQNIPMVSCHRITSDRQNKKQPLLFTKLCVAYKTIHQERTKFFCCLPRTTCTGS